MTLCSQLQELPKALCNSTFLSFLKQYGLDLYSVEYVSAEYCPGALPALPHPYHTRVKACMHICFNKPASISSMLFKRLACRLVSPAQCTSIVQSPADCMQSCAGLSTLQQAASLGYPSTVYTDRPQESRCRLPPWAWLVVAVAAVSLLVAGDAPSDQPLHDSATTSISVSSPD